MPLEHTENSVAEIEGCTERNGIELIRFLWVDYNSVTRGKAVSRQALSSRMRSGVGLARSRQAATLLTDRMQQVPEIDAVGEVRLSPDPGSYVRLPHAPGSAAMLCDLMTLDGKPWEACPRSFLKDALAAAGDLRVVAAFEPEFTLCSQRPAPGSFHLADDALCCDNEGFDAVGDYMTDLVRSLREQGLAVETCHPEYSPGQHEVTLRHGPALRAADNYVWQRAFTRGLARRHGLWATFAPLPRAGLVGNGNHVHLSLWREGHDGGEPVNLFASPGDHLGLTDLARHFIAGLLAHLPALIALTCASVNSYHRLLPGKWAGAYGAYGPDNREAAIRLPSRHSEESPGSTRIEFKACDSSANPYLALGALVHAGLDGVRRRLDPGEPLAEDPVTLSEGELRRRGVQRLPRSLGEAVEALERDEYLTSALGPYHSSLYPTLKRIETHDMAAAGVEAEFFTHAIRL
ncbi:glutamine synthetase [Streptomyces longispororuber]|uniref:Glutamine synthetase n=1 Tax=Streptomyces longispororuber TaxID=68230 RepID=A0A919DIQ7_9ACTN|nr:glutamine synthetase family protein [Streptomyces longispororuber]GHE48657.1 glutamine synthetase [Streptomyces longispororuber]